MEPVQARRGHWGRRSARWRCSTGFSTRCAPTLPERRLPVIAGRGSLVAAGGSDRAGTPPPGFLQGRTVRAAGGDCLVPSGGPSVVGGRIPARGRRRASRGREDEPRCKSRNLLRRAEEHLTERQEAWVASGARGRRRPPRCVFVGCSALNSCRRICSSLTLLRADASPNTSRRRSRPVRPSRSPGSAGRSRTGAASSRPTSTPPAPRAAAPKPRRPDRARLTRRSQLARPRQRPATTLLIGGDSSVVTSGKKNRVCFFRQPAGRRGTRRR